MRLCAAWSSPTSQHNPRYGASVVGRSIVTRPTIPLRRLRGNRADAEVQRVRRSALVFDTHNDVTSRTLTGFDIGKAATDGHTDIVRYRAGGFGAHSGHRAMEMIDTVRHDIIGRYPNNFELALTAADIVWIQRQ